MYATSTTALSRFARTWRLVKGEELSWNIPLLQGQNCAIADNRITTGDGVILEVFEGKPDPKEQGSASEIARWLAENALAPSAAQFREKLKKDLVILSDEVFTHFVENATVVEPHVAINDDTGTVDEGKLFYTENVPPEALFYSVVMASRERKKKGEAGNGLNAELILDKVKTVFDDAFVQMGGDATTGRGHVVLRFGI